MEDEENKRTPPYTKLDIDAEALFRLVKACELKGVQELKRFTDDPKIFTSIFYHPVRLLFGSKDDEALSLKNAKILLKSRDIQDVVQHVFADINEIVHTWKVRCTIRNGLDDMNVVTTAGLSVSFLPEKFYELLPNVDPVPFKIKGKVVVKLFNERWGGNEAFSIAEWYIKGNCALDTWCTALQVTADENYPLFMEFTENARYDETRPQVKELVISIGANWLFITVRTESARSDVVTTERFYVDNVGRNNVDEWFRVFDPNPLRGLRGTCLNCDRRGSIQRRGILTFHQYLTITGQQDNFEFDETDYFCPDCKENHPHTDIQFDLTSSGILVAMKGLKHNAKSYNIHYLLEKYYILDLVKIVGQKMRFLGAGIIEHNKKREPTHIYFLTRKKLEKDLASSSKEQVKSKKPKRSVPSDEEEWPDVPAQSLYRYYRHCDSEPFCQAGSEFDGISEDLSQISYFIFSKVDD